MATLLQLKSLWNESLGTPSVCVAVLDGPVDQSHPCFNGANLTPLPTLVSGTANRGFASQHGTHVASVIFGQHGSPIQGIAPKCRGLIVPVFADGRDGLAPCSQIDLARAITQAVEQGANVINISGGQLAASAESDQLLRNFINATSESGDRTIDTLSGSRDNTPDTLPNLVGTPIGSYRGIVQNYKP